MFVIEGGVVVISETTKPYIHAMPAAANEGIFLLASAGGTGVKKVTVNKTRANGTYETFDMNVLVHDFRGFTGEVYVETARERKRVYGYLTESSSVLLLPAWLEGEVTIYYYPLPKIITDLTPDNEEIELLPMAQTLLPLYMASQIFKGDDMRQAVQLRNEFETGLARLSAMLKQDGRKREKMESVTGWR